jgi:hypothetical protein
MRRPGRLIFLLALSPRRRLKNTDLQDSRCVLLDHKTVTFDKQLTTVVKRCMCHSTRL